MKLTLLFIILTGFLISCEKKDEAPNVKLEVEQVSESDILPDELNEEDCDDKLEKAEKEPAIIDLEKNGDQGCTIE